MIGEGISVNVRLIFTVERHRAVMDAYLAGLEAAKEGGHNQVEDSFGGVFLLLRVDTEIDDRLKNIGTD